MTSSLADVLPSVASLFGVPGADDRLELAAQIGRPRQVVLVLVDGLGHHLLPLLAPHAPLLAAVTAGTEGWRRELQSPFPSTTPTSIVTLGTGALPGAHGVLGFTLRVPGTDRVLNHIRWRDDPAPTLWQPLPTWWRRCADAGVDTRVVLPSVFLGSGLTEAAYGGARAVGVHERDDYGGRLVAEIGAGPGIVYGYTSELDTAAHVHGIDSAAWVAAAASVDQLLRRVREALPPDALLLVTADHGGRDIPGAGRLDIADRPELAHGVRVVAGEPRVRYLHTEPGATDDVLATWRDALAGRAQVLPREQAVANGWFGPVDPGHLPRIGDVVVVAEGDTAVLASDHEPPETSTLVGMHGALTPVETAIPLVGLTR